MVHLNKIKGIMKSNTKAKRGLSNIVGSLLMIILTIVAALLLGHFVFGLFSSNSHNAQISLSDISVIIPGGNSANAYVTVTVTDTGNDPVKLTSLTVANNQITGATLPVTIQPGQSVTLQGTIPTAQGTSPPLYVGQTIVVQATAQDINTGQNIATQATTVVQD
jgi:flagellin-like protein